jgi:GWxTD domain-containing protein
MIEVYEGGTDIWVLVPYEEFRFGGDEDEALYQISLQILGPRGKQVFSEESQLVVPQRQWLVGSAIPIKRRVDLATGKHQLNLILRNRKLGNKQSFQRSFPVGSQYTELGQAYIIASREGFSYIPEHLSLRNLESLQLYHRFSINADILHLDLDGSKTSIPSPTSPLELELLTLAETDSIATIALSLDEENIRYRLEPLLYKPWFSYNMRYSLKDQLDQLRYIANQNEWRVLSKISKDRYADAIESFWQAKDPSPGTLRNENREYFYQRVLHADEKFSIHKRLKGWKSDRGRIYIKFGEPDQIVSDAFPIGKAPSITWHYFSNNRSFVFTDEHGFGQYRLRNKDEEYMEF